MDYGCQSDVPVCKVFSRSRHRRECAFAGAVFRMLPVRSCGGADWRGGISTHAGSVHISYISETAGQAQDGFLYESVSGIRSVLIKRGGYVRKNCRGRSDYDGF